MSPSSTVRVAALVNRFPAAAQPHSSIRNPPTNPEAPLFNIFVSTPYKAAGRAVQIIDVSEHKPRCIPSAKWRELIKKVWEADPLLCPKCQKEMRVVSLIDERDVIERILRHLGLWQQGVRVLPARAPPEAAEWVVEPCYDLSRRSPAKADDPFPDYDSEPVMMYANG